MKFENIIKDLKNKVYHPVYFLMGDEPYYIETITDFIEDRVLDESEKEFNLSVLYGRDVDISTVLNQAKRYPMMASHNVVIVKEAQNLKGFEEDLEKYLKQPVETTILVFCYKGKKLDKRKKVTKELSKKGVLFESKKLYDNQVGPWITKMVKSKGFSIGPKASSMLYEFLGNDLAKISNEIGKLILNLQKGAEITPELIEQNIGFSKDYNNFELNNALGSRDVVKAQRIADYFARNEKAHPYQVTMVMLYSFFTKILNYHYLKDKSRNNAASVLGVHPFFVKDYQMAARNYSVKKAVNVISLLREYDLKSKGVDNTSTPSGELLKELIFRILH